MCFQRTKSRLITWNCCDCVVCCVRKFHLNVCQSICAIEFPFLNKQSPVCLCSRLPFRKKEITPRFFSTCYSKTAAVHPISSEPQQQCTAGFCVLFIFRKCDVGSSGKACDDLSRTQVHNLLCFFTSLFPLQFTQHFKSTQR